ncbi:hypothetical protein GCM10029964_059080 [Kibdelosporangium lantanae]
MKLLRLLGSTGYPQDDEWARRIGAESYEHRTDFAAARRQAAAARASGDRRAELATITALTPVLSGDADPGSRRAPERPPPTPSRARGS